MLYAIIQPLFLEVYNDKSSNWKYVVEERSESSTNQATRQQGAGELN